MSSMGSAVVIDASAVLAYLLEERGGEAVLEQIDGALISAVNWAEVVQRAISAGIDDRSLRPSFEALGVRILPVDAEQAELAAHLQGPTRGRGLSLADRICFALAATTGSAVLTADKDWLDLDLGVEVQLIR